MFCITVVPLSTPETITVSAAAAVRNARLLFLQTVRHPAARWILDERLAFTAMDDLYESAEDFDALNACIAERLAAAGDCVYAVTGAVKDTQLPAIQAAAERAGGRAHMLAGVTSANAAFPQQRIDVCFSAAQLPARIDPYASVAVEELSDAILAGEAKLLLGEYYPDDWTIQIAQMDASGRYDSRAIPLYALDRQPLYDAATVAFVPAARFDALDRFGFDDLCAVLRRLRAPDGCPWDREQTHASLRKDLMEECYELIDAIDSGADDSICEESGDVLMHAAFHAIIADEQGRFNERDVTSGIVRKLVYRHPHVFGSLRVRSSDEVLANWDKLKMAEKHQQTQTDVLQSVPRCFPALTRAAKVQSKAAKVGFDWPGAQDAIPKIAEETDELMRAMSGDGDVAEETGDLLFTAVNVARLLGLDAEFLLREATDKFITRFAEMERLATARGAGLNSLSAEEMEELWQTAKISRKE